MAIQGSILAKILAVISVVSLAAIATSGYLSIAQQQTFLRSLYLEKATALAQTIDAAVTQRDLEDHANLQTKLYKFILLNPDIIKITLALEDKGSLTVVASTDQGVIGSQAGEQSISVFHQKQMMNISVKEGATPALLVVAPTHIVGRTVGVYEIVVSTLEAQKAITYQLNRLIVVSLIALVTFIVGSTLLMRQIVIKPIQKLVEGVMIIGEGNLNHRVDVTGHDEIGNLARAFNDMAQKLQVSHAELEEKVIARTKELELKAKSLEDMNKLMVGRELRMVELKNELASVKKND